nr:ribosomal protein S2 [Chlorosarcina stigmatica]
MVTKQKNFAKQNKPTGSKKKSLRIGNIYDFKITAIGPNNVGIDEFSYNYSVLVPNAQLGEQVKAKILKINTQSAFNKSKYAIGKIIKDFSVAQMNTGGEINQRNVVNNLNVGTQLDVQIGSIGPKSLEQRSIGIAQVGDNYKLIIPGASQGQKLTVEITRLKANYGFAKIVTKESSRDAITVGKISGNIVKEGSKFNLTLPKKAKRYLKHVVLKLDGAVLFLKLKLGAKLGNKVKVKLVKVVNSKNNTTFAIGKVVKLNPISYSKKQTIIKNSLRQMLKSGMHFGEKAVKCHARMKKYVWLRQTGQNKNKPLIKKGRNVINLFKTRRCLKKALNQLAKYAAKGRTFLFVGTKKSVSGLIARASLFSKTSFFVNTRWLGGMLTNWKTMLKAVKKIRPILKEKQIIMRDIVQKRQEIKNRLLQKAVILRKKSKALITKGRQLLEKATNANNKALLKEKSQQLATKRKELIEKGQQLLRRRQKLVEKLSVLTLNTENLKQKSVAIATKHKTLLNLLSLNRKKVRELNTLCSVAERIQKLKQEAKEQNKSLYTVSYSKLQQLMSIEGSQSWIVPDPSKQLLTKVVVTMKNAKTLDSNLGVKAYGISEATDMLVLSRLLNNFSTFIPYIKSSMELLLANIKNITQKLQTLKETLEIIKSQMVSYLNLKNQVTSQLLHIKTNLSAERRIVKILKRKLKQLRAEKRIIKYLPNLRFLPTPQTKIAEIVPILMQKIVDPKMKYPMDILYNERLSMESKKVAAARKKKWQRLEKYFGGIAHMAKLNKQQISKNVAIIIGQRQEMNAVRECQKLGIKMFHVVDTNCNPSLADHFIPANDDSRNSVKFILTKFLSRIRLAQKIRIRLQKKLKAKKKSVATTAKKNFFRK